MDEADRNWIDRWSRTPYARETTTFLERLALLTDRRHGSDSEPSCSIRLASYSQAIEDRFREGVAVLDYGCGAGRYAHFMQQRLESFTYFGVEQPGASTRHGEESIEAARALFYGDPRIQFGLIGSQLDLNAISVADVAILASIFTHLDLDRTTSILQKLRPIAWRGGAIAFSIFVDDHYHFEDEGLYGFEQFYNRVWFTREQIAGVCRQLGLSLEERETFLASDANLHRIFVATSGSG